ncbi:MAG: hypothetical protein JW839_09970 [Candidatus Lokiarchaeota archaeon]|nr:hypothetical protein [Candidatus Lokiarchaeota archaeon]
MDDEETNEDSSTDEDVGVKLPIIRIATVSTTIIVSGLVPDSLIVMGVLWLVSTTPQTWIALVAWVVLAPLIFWSLYFVYLGTTVLVTRAFLAYFDLRSKPSSTVLRRQFKDKGHPDYRTMHYYHMRGAVVKYPVWIVLKCPIPSLIARVSKYLCHNVIGKRILHENSYPGLELTEIGDDVVLEAGSTVSTHVVESLYGNIVRQRVEVGRGVVLGINSVIGPGAVVADGSHVGDNSIAYQKWPLVKQEGIEGDFFNGMPARHRDEWSMFADGQLKDRYRSLKKKNLEATGRFHAAETE